MEKPKPKPGRPRRAAWAAHDARRIARQIEIAEGTLRHIGWLLSEYPEVATAMHRGVPDAFAWYVTTTVKTERALREMLAVVRSRRAAGLEPVNA